MKALFPEQLVIFVEAYNCVRGVQSSDLNLFENL